MGRLIDSILNSEILIFLLFDNRLHDSVLEIAAHRFDRFLNHHDTCELILAIDPEVGAERAVPAEAAVAER